MKGSGVQASGLYFRAFFAFCFPFCLISCIVVVSYRERNDVS